MGDYIGQHPAKIVRLKNQPSAALNLFEGEFDWFVIGEEKHEDGCLHHHLVGFRRAGYDVRSPAHLERWSERYRALAGREASIRVEAARRTSRECLAYIMKEDQEPFCFGIDLEEVKKEASSKRARGERRGIFDEVANKLKAGSSLKDIIEEYPGFSLANLRKIREFSATLSEFGLSVEVPPVQATLELFGRSLTVGVPLPPRSRHLWVCSRPREGKTHEVVEKLKERKVYWVTKSRSDGNGNWIGLSGWIDVFVVDDCSASNLGRMEPAELFALMDGYNAIQLNVKGGHAMKMAGCVPWIFLSNMRPEGALYGWPQEQVQAFLDRVTVLEWTNPLRTW